MDLLNNAITYIANPLIYLMIGVATIYFLWGVLVFVRNAENSEKRIVGANHILWGVVGLAIMFSVFALMHVIKNTIGTVAGEPAYPASLK